MHNGAGWLNFATASFGRLPQYLKLGKPSGVANGKIGIQEHTEGVFSRRWSKGTASLDCHRYKGALPFPNLPEAQMP